MKLCFTLALIISSLNCMTQLNLSPERSNSEVFASYHDSKRIVDTNAFNNWPEVFGGAISNDGKYVLYITQSKSTYNFRPTVAETSTIIQSVDRKWKCELKNITNVKFSDNSQTAVFINGKGSLYLMKLRGGEFKVSENVKSYQLVSCKNNEWLVFDTDNELVIRDMQTGTEQKFENVLSYRFSPNGQHLILNTYAEEKGESKLEWIALKSVKRFTIWSAKDAKPGQILFDNSGKRLAFLVDQEGDRFIWYFSQSSQKARILATDKNQELKIGSFQRFSKDGQRLFLVLEEKTKTFKYNSEATKVTVWSYDDLILPSEQSINSKNELKSTFFSVLDVKNGNIMQLQYKNEIIKNSDIQNDDNFILLHLDADKEVSKTEVGWNPAYKYSSLHMVSMRNGSRHQLPWKDINLSSVLSSNNKYIIFWNDSLSHYFSFDIATGAIRNITYSISTDLTIDAGYRVASVKSPIGLAGWEKNDERVLIYDRHDIWLVNPGGTQKPENITNGFGKFNNTILRLATEQKLIKQGEKLILAAFNTRTKKNGYYYIIVGQKDDPVPLIMDDCLYTSLPLFSNFRGNFLKAKYANAWLLMRQTVNESPNYFWTEDLKIIRPVSNVCPEKTWNWLTSELHSWVAYDGDTLQGILYKPENFDSSKKYPIIFNYYRQLSNELHKYRKPQGTNSSINIPWFVSRGYLVFTPDIHHKVPDLKAGVLNCVLSAADYIAKLSFVDPKRMGINGHSFGGLETGIIVTNTSLFAAAVASSGYYNLVSDVGSLLRYSLGAHRTTSESHMGGTLWQKQNDFIQNSSIFYLDKITTPILIMTGNKDGQVPHEQSVELFLGLRRLNKKSWMLSYDGEGHTLWPKKLIDDYTLRITQFFDHFLKGAPVPKWMTNNLPSLLKGTEIGFELDFKRP